MEDDEILRLSTAKFWILLVLSISSSICTIFIFIYFYRERKKLTLHHHLIFALVTMSLIQMISDFPFAMIYYHYGVVMPSSDGFCLWWNFWDYSISGAPIFVMAWGSIERHILIFHNSLMNTRKKRILFHILPMLSVCIYPFIFYFAAIIVNSCENAWDYEWVLCLQPCFLVDQPILAMYDTIANIFVPVFIISLANIVLIGRVFWQKRNRPDAWRRQRKLTIQLLSISVFYVIFWFPMSIDGLVYAFWVSPILGDLLWKYFFFLPSILTMIIPFISLPNLPDFKKVVFKIQPSAVAPAINANRRLPNVQT